MTGTLERRIGLVGATSVGVSSMVGAGLFVVFAPAVDAAGDGLPVALTIAAVVAVCNATSSARLARLHPVAGGTYVYGRERLGPFWGHLAGWSFVVGKLASCAAMATAIGAYAWPEHARPVAVGVVLALTVVNLCGVQKSVVAGIVVVSVVLVVVAVVVATLWSSPSGDARAGDAITTGGVLEAAGLLFFAFAGYARLATLGEEVRDPSRTIPRAITISVVVVVTLYAASALALLHVLGPARLASSDRPFVTALDVADASALVPFVVAAAALAAGGALLSLLLGVSRTTLAMARDGHLPRQLALVGERHRVPYVAEAAAGGIAAVLVMTGELATSIAFSSFCVLVYYAVANAAALTLAAPLLVRGTAALGLAGCLVLAGSLPMTTVLGGLAVVAAGAAAYGLQRVATRR